MATLDIFNTDAFSTVEMLDAVERVDFKPQRLGEMGLFTPRPVRTDTVAVEERDGKLALIQTSPRGTAPEQRTTTQRKVHSIPIPRITKGDRITAAEVAGIREFGTESELMQVVKEVETRLNGPDGLRSDVDLTHENMRLGAIQGVVTDKDSSTIADWFSIFGITPPTEIAFDFGNTATGDLRPKITDVVRLVVRGLKGLGSPNLGVHSMCGDDFWDELTKHQEVRDTFLATQAAADLREGKAFGSFPFGGVTWENFRGTDDNSTVAVPTAECKFFPSNVSGAFTVAWGPSEFLPWVNQPGREIFPLIIPDRDREAWVDIEVYSYPLFICNRPEALQKGRAGV